MLLNTTSPLRVIKPKAMINNKGREGGHKIKKLADVVHGWLQRGMTININLVVEFPT
jgi:hypothetical protein